MHLCIFEACGVFERIMFILFYDFRYTVQNSVSGIKDALFFIYQQKRIFLCVKI